MSDSPSTKILDHIVHLTPPGSVEATSEQFRRLGFNVIPGGTHTDGLTANALVILADGVYIELICFTHPPSYYPPGSPERHARDSHHWASKALGWIDFAFVGNGSLATRISDVINARARRDGSGAVYSPEVPGGRERTDGKVLKWLITAPEDDAKRGTLPFFCGDITPREWRVPVDPPSNTEHPSTAQGVSHVVILASPEDFSSISRQLTSVTGDTPVSSNGAEIIWQLNCSKTRERGPRLLLRSAVSDAEVEFVRDAGTGIYEVGLLVKVGGRREDRSTPYGRIVWCPA
ncbi:putative glyoxalase-like domain containing protein [Lyophyllum shimeji]|uniref:Glyoxalase-like domain containing protein n=1 Tax=Lyophyllum shimeji TaxID=47721 RepID=A0A9P3PHG0_LYOSH|nr:putative glyoxalase-like domain containing protein [Lyophyllum shimeji]